MEKLQNIIDENIKYFWENDPILENETEELKLWDAFKLWCIPNLQENFEDLDKSFIEKVVNKNFDNWKSQGTL